MRKIKVKVTQIRVGYIELNPDYYPKDNRDYEHMIEIERENASDDVEYMDYLDATEVFTFERVDEKMD